MSASKETTWSVMIAGLGNTGSQAALAAARIPGVCRLILVDPDTCEEKNVAAQAIPADAAGLPKVEAVARELRRIRADLEIRTFQDRVERVPWGLLRADLFLGCLDNKAARLGMNRIAGRLGAAFVDAGVAGAGMLARVSVIPGGDGGACLECGWGRADYAHMEVAHPCQGGEIEAPATNAPAYLGMLAASLQVLEGHRLLLGENQGPEAAGACEWLVDGRHRKSIHSSLRPNPACRFRHGVIDAEVLRIRPEDTTLGSLLSPGYALELEGDEFVRDLVCAGCGSREPVLVLRRQLRAAPRLCAGCGEPMLPLGFTMCSELAAGALAGPDRDISLAAAGIRRGDVFRTFCSESVTPERACRYYEMATEP